MKHLLPLVLITLAQPIAAQEVSECDWRANAQAIVEPWEDNSRSFSNGVVRLTLLDVSEPAATAAYLMVQTPPYQEMGDRKCAIIGLSDGLGFSTISFDALQADYDPAQGLVFKVPVLIYDPETAYSQNGMMQVIVNQATGDIAASLEVGIE